jgi:C-terminal processing protease CtpA/Prc
MLEEIEEQKISSASVYEVASLLLGPVGTRVKLKIRRRNTGGYNCIRQYLYLCTSKDQAKEHGRV